MLLRCRMAVNAAAETVFACVDEPEHIVQWVEGAVEHTYISGRNPANPVGQRFLQKLRMGKSIKEFYGEIIAWEAPTHFGLSIPAPAYSSEAHFRITPKGATQSTVDYSIDITLHKTLARILSPLLRIPLTLFVRKQIGRLKAYAEKVQTKQPATSLRLLRVDDFWVYRAAGTLTPPGAAPLELTGQISVSIVQDRLAGRSDWKTILFSQRFEVLQPDGSRQPMPAPEWMFSFIQDPASRELSIVADNMTKDGTPRIAKAPQVFYPGSWSLQTAYDNRLEFDNGDQVNNTLQVFDREQVETEAGSFPSWVARISSESAATGRIEGKDWWTPDLGAPAKFATSSTMPDGSQMHFVATLQSSSVR